MYLARSLGVDRATGVLVYLYRSFDLDQARVVESDGATTGLVYHYRETGPALARPGIKQVKRKGPESLSI